MPRRSSKKDIISIHPSFIDHQAILINKIKTDPHNLSSIYIPPSYYPPYHPSYHPSILLAFILSYIMSKPPAKKKQKSLLSTGCCCCIKPKSETLLDHDILLDDSSLIAFKEFIAVRSKCTKNICGYCRKKIGTKRRIERTCTF